jgi:carboxymethylenebutenolidase
MCFEPDSLPPVPAIAGAAVSHEDLVLEAADGNRLAAFDAIPDAAIGAGVVVLPDVRGLYRFYEELALRFAERGIRAVAIDYFGRTAGVAKRPDEWDYMDHVGRTTRTGIQADVRAAVERLRSPEGGGCAAIFTVGFCFGGSQSWVAAASGHGLAGAIGFYGRPGTLRDGSPGALASAGEMEAPILALMGGADQAIPPEDVAAFERALEEAGVEHEVVTYEGAPHSFFDRKQEQFAEASDDAWRRVLAFIGAHAGAGAEA